MNSKIYAYMFALGGMMVLLAGCGSGGTTPVKTGHALTESYYCIGCHQDSQNAKWATPGSGKSVVTEWMASTHNTNDAAGCKNCHGSDFDNPVLHPTSCSKCHTIGGLVLNDASANPDSQGRCAKCHAKVNPRPTLFDGYKPLTYSDPLIPVGSTTRYTHYSTGAHGNYVSKNYVNKCRTCHNPHDTSFGRDQRKQWAESGHGNTTAAFRRSSTDFKGRGSSLKQEQNFGPYCVVCHTSTGYINFVTSGFSNVNALPDFDGTQSNYPKFVFIRNQPDPYIYTDKSRETTNCDVCHIDSRNDGGKSSYSGSLRTVAAPAMWYTYSSHPAGAPLIRAKMQVQYDSLGQSNACVVCHAGREAGDIIKEADKQGLFDYTGTTSTTRPSGITPHDFTSGANLQGKSGFHFYTSMTKYTSDPAHKTRGFEISPKGACIGCHMTNSTPHLFQAVEWNNGNFLERILNVRSEALCNTCHSTSPRNAAYMNAQRDRYRAAVAALKLMIPASNNWKNFGTYIVPGSGGIHAGAYTMGTNFVYNIYIQDPAGYTHNATYTKQLIYDSIDWLADGSMDFNGTNATQVYTKVNALADASLLLSPSTGVTYGQGGVLNGTPFSKQQVFEFLCKNQYSDVIASGRCDRW